MSNNPAQLRPLGLGEILDAGNQDLPEQLAFATCIVPGVWLHGASRGRPRSPRAPRARATEGWHPESFLEPSSLRKPPEADAYYARPA